MKWIMVSEQLLPIDKEVVVEFIGGDLRKLMIDECYTKEWQLRNYLRWLDESPEPDQNILWDNVFDICIEAYENIRKVSSDAIIELSELYTITRK
jgi:hypothetical protein